MPKKNDALATSDRTDENDELVERVAPDGTKYKVDKVEAFIEEYFKNGGSATKAANTLSQFPTISAAAVEGTRLLKEAKKRGLMRLEMEKLGLGLPSMIEIAQHKMMASKKPEWWDRLMKMGGYEDFMSKKNESGGQISVNIFEAHKQLANDYLEEAEVVEADDDKAD